MISTTSNKTFRRQISTSDLHAGLSHTAGYIMLPFWIRNWYVDHIIKYLVSMNISNICLFNFHFIPKYVYYGFIPKYSTHWKSKEQISVHTWSPFYCQEKLQINRLTSADCRHVLQVSNGSPKIKVSRQLHRWNLKSTKGTIHHIWVKRMINVTTSTIREVHAVQ